MDIKTSNRNSEQNFLEIIFPYIPEFKWFFWRIYNGFFESVDVELYYSIIRKFKPNLIVEVGAGFSTHFAVEALKRNGKGEIVCIDPKPRRDLPKMAKVIPKRVEEVRVEFFTKLSQNDILFIDSSHTTQEAIYWIERIFPNLKAGLLIHHHDILYPYAIYHRDDPQTFGEPDVILNFYWKNSKQYNILTSTAYIKYKNSALFKSYIKSYRWYPQRIPGSLWVQKVS